MSCSRGRAAIGGALRRELLVHTNRDAVVACAVTNSASLVCVQHPSDDARGATPGHHPPGAAEPADSADGGGMREKHSLRVPPRAPRPRLSSMSTKILPAAWEAKPDETSEALLEALRQRRVEAADAIAETLLDRRLRRRK